ncbi:hypothetical protein EXU85_34655 [Spirosoma sp. KCTC 42546]|uniref:hypothetical protein n=1 Tax=Spirosoma sp. KCTC 42546 TaxID=2520506 RepID=UPI00115B46AC|nr:hypothetical protein [Spirosoma sp. KCTC 42546]QDK83472.1 hypothetical protein EXU85_34655 [Spirosoma sp. KCTC 42546]
MKNVAAGIIHFSLNHTGGPDHSLKKPGSLAEPGFVYCGNQNYISEFTNTSILFCCATAQNDDADGLWLLKS